MTRSGAMRFAALWLVGLLCACEAPTAESDVGSARTSAMVSPTATGLVLSRVW
jgi:hypothetical protein